MHSCSTCAAGLFSNPGAKICRSCPEFSNSDAGTACGCFKGFTGPVNGPCFPCAAATYKDVNGSSACSPCPSPAWAPAASTTLSACTTAASGEVLKIKIGLAISMIEFDAVAFAVRDAFAASARVDVSRVQIVSVVERRDGRRRLLSRGIALQVAIDFNPGQSGVITIDNLNQEFGRRGLPQGTLLETATFFDCSTCESGTFQTSACTFDADRRCQSCRARCNLGYWEKTPCTPESDRFCSLCTWCGATEYQLAPCTTTTDRICHECTSSSNTQVCDPSEGIFALQIVRVFVMHASARFESRKSPSKQLAYLTCAQLAVVGRAMHVDHRRKSCRVLNAHLSFGAVSARLRVGQPGAVRGLWLLRRWTVP